eukprot:TRINITY_DN34336_c0_g1_i1.p1 TRINITY_DN34336_c0_g1~~TRINITY_DN34336_c0_g1_i1.p1  ORF type:complete len:967 (+),score=149.16 TRINITY_DN34336_c0_g1_i1:182-3082(+)
MARRQDTGILPYILTFCRPANLPNDGVDRQLFAIIGDGFHEERISVWPKLGLPFPMNPRRILSVRIFVADDEVVFDRGGGKEVAACCLPIWRLPEVVPASAARDGDLPELWLALEPPRPLRDGGGVGGIFRSGSAGLTSGGGCSSSVALRDAASREEEEAELQAEMLGRFERARGMAIEDPSCPRICVIVQARQDISSVMSAMMRHSPSSQCGGATLAGYPALTWAGGGSDAAVGVAWSNGPVHDGIVDLCLAGGGGSSWPGGSGGSSAGPGQCHVESRLFSTAVQASANSAGVESALGGVGTSKATLTGRPTSSDSVWKMKWNEERQRLEDQRARYQREMQTRRLETRRHVSRLEHVGMFVWDRDLRCWEAACLSLWRLWLVDEKRQRQLDQLAVESAKQQSVHDEHMERLEEDLEQSALGLQDQDEAAKLQLQAWLDYLPVVEALIGHDGSGHLLARSISAWHARAARRASAKRVFAEGRRSTRRSHVRLVLASWRAQVGWQKVEEVQQKVLALCAELPRKVRRACAEHTFRAARFSGADADCGATMAALLAELVRGALMAWARATTATVVLRQRLGRILRSHLRAGLEFALPLRCLVLWRSMVSRTEAATVAERKAGKKVLDYCRCRGAHLLQSSLWERVACHVFAAMLCWRFLVAHRKLQLRLEDLFNDHQRAQARSAGLLDELEGLRSHHESEYGRIRDRDASLTSALRHAEVEAERCVVVLRNAFEDRVAAETRRSDALARSRGLVDELRSIQMREIRARSFGESVEERCDAAEREACIMVLGHEEAKQAADLGQQKLQQEATRTRDRRYRDVRDARQQLRVQIARQEDGAMRLDRAHREDEELRAQKLRHAERQASRLHEEVNNLKQGILEMPGRAAAMEEEGAELLAQVLSAEKDLQTVESSEQARRSEVAQLRAVREELLARCEALEVPRGSPPPSPSPRDDSGAIGLVLDVSLAPE